MVSRPPPDLATLLAMHPVRTLDWLNAKEGRVTVLQPKLGTSRLGTWLSGWLARPFRRLRLDQYGSLVWRACDGTHTVQEIADSLQVDSEERGEHLPDRLTRFLRRLEREGIRSPFSLIKQSLNYADQSEAEAEFKKLGDQIRTEGLPEQITPFVVGITGYGNVSRGVQHMLDFLPIKEVHPDQIHEIEKNSVTSSNTIYKVVFKEKDMVTSVSARTTFDLQEYYNYPERYKAKFELYLKYISILVNASFWDTPYPRHLTKDNLKKLFSGTGKPSLRVIGDISCDVDGGIECTVKTTDPGNPVYVYEPENDAILDGVTGNGPVIMAVDNLPSELPKDASVYFSSVFREYIPVLVAADFSVGFDDLNLPYSLTKAVIVFKGELTREYTYLKKYL